MLWKASVETVTELSESPRCLRPFHASQLNELFAFKENVVVVWKRHSNTFHLSSLVRRAQSSPIDEEAGERLNRYVLRQLFPYLENVDLNIRMRSLLGVKVTDLRDRIDPDDRVHFRELGEVKNPFGPLNTLNTYQGD